MNNNSRPRKKRLELPRDTLRKLTEQDLQQAAGGTCYSDPRISQCCPDI
jgi:hypothetical protein